MSKRQVTITVDEDLLEEARAAVGDGRSLSVSEWVAGAMAQRVATDRRLSAIGELIRDFEAEHGVITEDEIVEQAQVDRDAAAASRMAARQVA
ncbi:MAG: hypothetical protein J4G11_02610 [Acidimicrobiia bacterium]|nr:hypothetical protein [Acidimicrobiia bacterium]